MFTDTIQELRSFVSRNTYKHTPYVMLRKEYLYSLIDRMEREYKESSTIYTHEQPNNTHDLQHFPKYENYSEIYLRELHKRGRI